jgi:hypothetical protein
VAWIFSTIRPSRVTHTAAESMGVACLAECLTLQRSRLRPKRSRPLWPGRVFGVVVVMFNHAEPTPLRVLSIVIGGGAGWAAFGILMAAWWRRRLVLSIAAATFALAAAVAAYYVADSVPYDTPLALYFPEMRFWILGALVVGPPPGLLGWRARGDGTWLGLAALLIAPLGFAAESAIYLDGFEWLSPLERATRLTIIGAALTGAAIMVGQKLTRPVERQGRPTS